MHSSLSGIVNAAWAKVREHPNLAGTCCFLALAVGAGIGGYNLAIANYKSPTLPPFVYSFRDGRNSNNETLKYYFGHITTVSWDNITDNGTTYRGPYFILLTDNKTRYIVVDTDTIIEPDLWFNQAALTAISMEQVNFPAKQLSETVLEMEIDVTTKRLPTQRHPVY
jgi:hypothetical protein